MPSATKSKRIQRSPRAASRPRVGWDTLAADLERQIAHTSDPRTRGGLEAALRVARRRIADGDPWPGEPTPPRELVRVATKVAAWLEQLADAAEGRTTDTADRFPALSDANRADAENYRAVARDLRRALAAEDSR